LNWKEIKGYEGLYEVSDTGSVRGVDRYIPIPGGKTRFKKGGLLISRINNCGYNTVRLSKAGKTSTCFIHRLVATAFVPNPNNLPEVNHVYGNKLDNTPGSLQWVSHADNVKHAYSTGLSRNRGSSHSRAVCISSICGGKIFGTIKAFCRHYGINYNTGRNIFNGYSPFPKIAGLENTTFIKVRGSIKILLIDWSLSRETANHIYINT
jgi:hypothetical protein